MDVSIRAAGVTPISTWGFLSAVNLQQLQIRTFHLFCAVNENIGEMCATEYTISVDFKIYQVCSTEQSMQPLSCLNHTTTLLRSK